MTDQLEAMKKKLTAKKQQARPQWVSGLSSGSTLLNLACSGRTDIGFLRGGIYFFVGDSGSGKSFFTLTSLAEAANNEQYDQYQLIFDNAENGALMDFSRFFGNKMASRLRPPAGTVDDPIYSTTVEQMYFHLDNVLKQGPAIYVLDSMDALTTSDEGSKFDECKKAKAEGKEKEITGTYGTSKAKLNSTYLRVVFNRLRETGSIFILISQTRDNIGFGAQYNPKTRSGGRALTFYSNLEIWSSVKGHIKTTYKGKPREQGVICLLHVKKNRLTGRDRRVEVPILHSFGIDDIGSMVDYLIEEKHWSQNKGRITAQGVDYVGYRESLIEYIQDNNLEEALRLQVQQVWSDIENSIEVKRRKRFQ